MDVIEIQPHHLLQVYWRSKGKEPNMNYYDSKLMEERDKEISNKLNSNPNQKVRIVSGLDSLCEVCPFNKFGSNYDSSLPTDYCSLGQTGVSDSTDEFSQIQYGVSDLVDNSEITALQLNQCFDKGGFLKAVEKTLINNVKKYFKTK